MHQTMGSQPCGQQQLASFPSSLTSKGRAQASLMAVLLASLPEASALSVSAEAAVTASKGMASRSFTKRGMPYCSLQSNSVEIQGAIPAVTMLAHLGHVTYSV